MTSAASLTEEIPTSGGTERLRASVVIPTRDRAPRLRALLACLEAQTIGADAFEALVVDDGSKDGTAELLKQAKESGDLNLNVLRQSGKGPAAARNKGWRAARSTLVVFTDDDCEPAPQWLERIVTAAEQQVGAIIQGPTSPIPREEYRLHPFARTRRIEAEGPWYETCNIAYPRDLLEALDGFDERFPEALGEDTELGWRARALGADLAFVRAARTHHAVDVVGPWRKLREATRGSDSVLVFKLHPGLRRETTVLGVFRNPSLARATVAIAGLFLSRRAWFAILAASPYALDIAGRVRANRGRPWHVPFFVACDAAAAFSSLRGSARHRTLVL